MSTLSKIIRHGTPKRRYACDHVHAGAEVNTRVVQEDAAMDLCQNCAQRQESLYLTEDGKVAERLCRPSPIARGGW
jgi:hypothetical protein